MIEDNQKTRGLGSSSKSTDNDPVTTVIMFADIAGASEVSNYFKPKDYAKFVSNFQKKFKDACIDYVKDEVDGYNYLISVRGDEGLMMLFQRDTESEEEIPKEIKVPKYVDLAINVALSLKRRWIGVDENVDRIESGLLPIDLGIGINVGATILTTGKKEEHYNEGGWIPEGYSINLAKRIESESRKGKHTRIFVSEAAHGLLMKSPDEQNYLFDEQQTITAKGFSKDIRAFEVKHHFLPTDWTEEDADDIILETPARKDLLLQAFKANPTNLWLAEEYIRTSMVDEYKKLSNENDEYMKLLRNKDNCLNKLLGRVLNNKKGATEKLEHFKKRVSDMFEDARDTAAYLALSDQRDAGILLIQGLIEGECFEFKKERELYKDAIEFTRQILLVHWYRASSLSMTLSLKPVDIDFSKFSRLIKNNKNRFIKNLWGKYDETGKLEKAISDNIDYFRQIVERSPKSAWFNYDLGRELVYWELTPEDVNEGKKFILDARKLLPKDVEERIEKDKIYLSEAIRNELLNEESLASPVAEAQEE